MAERPPATIIAMTSLVRRGIRSQHLVEEPKAVSCGQTDVWFDEVVDVFRALGPRLPRRA